MVRAQLDGRAAPVRLELSCVSVEIFRVEDLRLFASYPEEHDPRIYLSMEQRCGLRNHW